MLYPADATTRFIEIYFWGATNLGNRLKGIKLLDHNRVCCLDVGVTMPGSGKCIKVRLGENERIVGVISR